MTPLLTKKRASAVVYVLMALVEWLWANNPSIALGYLALAAIHSQRGKEKPHDPPGSAGIQNGREDVPGSSEPQQAQTETEAPAPPPLPDSAPG